MTIQSIDSFSKLGNFGDGIGKISTNSTREVLPMEAGEEAQGAGSFGDLLKTALQDANQSQLDADKAVQELMAGRNKDLHGTMIAMEKADVNFRLLTQVRNKVIDAYREVMRMQV